MTAETDPDECCGTAPTEAEREALRTLMDGWEKRFGVGSTAAAVGASGPTLGSSAAPLFLAQRRGCTLYRRLKRAPALNALLTGAPAEDQDRREALVLFDHLLSLHFHLQTIRRQFSKVLANLTAADEWGDAVSVVPPVALHPEQDPTPALDRGVIRTLAPPGKGPVSTPIASHAPPVSATTTGYDHARGVGIAA